MKRIVIFSGAGISAESGLETFRDSGGLWEKYKIDDVATPDAFNRNPERVLDFYNNRRRAISSVKPNAAHLCLTALEKLFDVTVITQNIDDLHERAGSKQVLHLHGEITKAKVFTGIEKPIEIGYSDIKIGDLAKNGSQLRPHIVWFGEEVPEYENAKQIISTCDVLIVVGTSLNIYPAAGLIHYAPIHSIKIIIDPNQINQRTTNGFKVVKEPATIGLPELVRKLVDTKLNEI